ncbi:unnamed protein product [Vitrella brassicaformis CCMP3155]|uniref:Uncharacterized protein n=1 Tax=Vitrella brassicaformis (strain CCMP3155) TaxID=1169540 RepID=A0A0G4FE99_VITBC|nr:unnamed protein product [Vitrella brassicaformis CCMP3155]|eukprot:CEM11185.1 unnamed protein product [Vitrella brassicaformis CCMP3155]
MALSFLSISFLSVSFLALGNCAEVLAESFALSEEIRCQRLYAPQMSKYFETFSSTLFLEAGRQVLIEAQLRTRSSTTTNMLAGFRLYAIIPGTNRRDYAASGGGLVAAANHVGRCGVRGDPGPCEDTLTLRGYWVYTAKQTANVPFFMESRAQTTASDIDELDSSCPEARPRCPGPGQPSSTSCHLAINTGNANSYIRVWEADAAIQFLEDCRWAAGYGTVNADTSPVSILRRTVKTPEGRSEMTAISHVGLTIDNTVAQPTVTRARLILTSLTSNTSSYFPSEAGTVITISPEKHHYQLRIEGAVPVEPGERIRTNTEISLVSGNWIRIDTGCDAGCELSNGRRRICTGATTRQVDMTVRFDT